MFSLALADSLATDRFGQCLAHAITQAAETIAQSGLNIRLEGNLGAGKTSTVRATLRELGVTGRIKSPTFTLLESYPLDHDLEAFHFDFYRFEDPEEFLDAGFRDNFGAGFITLVEWSEKAGPCLPPADITIDLRIDGNARVATIEAHSSLGQNISSEIQTSWL